MARNLERELSYADMKNGVTGLTNRSGENNCFLNSTVQVLWHLDAFRRSFRTMEQHTCTANPQGSPSGDSCIFCALKILFTHFQYSDQGNLPPDSLRTAMADAFAFEHRFQLRKMEDATECFEQILSSLHCHLTGGKDEGLCSNIRCIPHQQFAMIIDDSTICSRCACKMDMGQTMQTINYVSTSVLLSASAKSRQLHPQYDYFDSTVMKESFGRVLKHAMNTGDQRPCPVRECRMKTRLVKKLINTPEFVTIGLNWDSGNPTDESLGAVIGSISCSLKLSDMFDESPPEVARRECLSLVAMMCYYGKHYSAFLYRAKMNVWISADDTSVKEIGCSWESVVEKCFRGRYQPLLLVYGSCDVANNLYATVGTADSRKPADTQGGGGMGSRGGPSQSNTRNTTGASVQTGATLANGGNGAGVYGSQASAQKKRPEPPARSFDTRLVGRSRQPSYVAAVNHATATSTSSSFAEPERVKLRPSTAGPRLASASQYVDNRAHRRSCDAETLFAAHDFTRARVVANSDVTGDHSSPTVDAPVLRRDPRLSSKGRAVGSGFRNSVDVSQWIDASTGNDDDDGVAAGRYIDPRVVENVLRCRQMMTTSSNLLKTVRRQAEPSPKTNLCTPLTIDTSGSGQSLDADFSGGRRQTIGDCGLKLETADIDRDSGISGDRNSASSTSSGLSVESSLTSLISTDEYATGDRTNCSSSTMSCSSSLEQLDNPAVRTLRRSAYLGTPGVATTIEVAPVRSFENDLVARLNIEASAEKYNRTLKRRSAKATTGDVYRYTANTGETKTYANADDWCSQLLLEADSLTDSCAEYERTGDVTKASIDCERAIDLLKTAEGATGVSQDMLIRLRMKRNAVVLTSRRLQRLVTVQSETMTSSRSLTSHPAIDHARGSSESSCEPSSSTHLSKEEVGEILVQEMERRRLRSAPVPSVRSLPKDPTADDKARLKYEDMLKRQLKTFAAKEKGHCFNGIGDYDNGEKLRNSCDLDSDTSCSRRFPSSGLYSTETRLRDEQQGRFTRADSVDSSNLPHSMSDNSIRLSANPTIRPQCPPTSCSSPAAAAAAAAEIASTKADVHRRSVPDIFMSGNVSHVTGSKMRKTVTFSDSVKLLCCDADEIIPVTRVNHPRTTNAVGILKNCSPTYASSDADTSISASGNSLRTAVSDLDLGRESDGTSADDSDAELDEVSPDGRTRCGLCRRKWADPGVTYCQDCGAYMSKLQPVR